MSQNAKALYDPTPIKVEMAKNDLTAQDLATQVKMTPNTVGGILKGRDTKISTLRRIAETLQIPLSSLFLLPSINKSIDGIREAS